MPEILGLVKISLRDTLLVHSNTDNTFSQHEWFQAITLQNISKAEIGVLYSDQNSFHNKNWISDTTRQQTFEK